MAQIPSGTKFIGIDASILTPELNGSRVNSKTQHYTVEDIAAFAGVGSEGPQGVEGPAGPPGPVGPAGLEWQGSWDTDSSYNVDDAVGFNGASWFCISEVTGTGNSNPEEDTVSWALLAAQGATGPQGAQGPTGPQGAQGEPGSFSYTEGSLNADSSSFVEFTKLEQNFTRVYVSSPTDNYIGISNVGLDTGSVYVVQNKSTVNNLIVRPVDNAKFLQTNGFDTQSDFTVKANTYARFTLVDNTSGSDKVFMVEVINPLGMFNSYKEFTARVFQGSILNPIVLTVIKNDFETIPTVENDFGSPYDFLATLEDEFVFEKTVVTSTPERNNIIISYPSNDDSTVYFNCFDFAGEQSAPISFTFTIKVYN
jgi:hypothetical protein